LGFLAAAIAEEEEEEEVEEVEEDWYNPLALTPEPKPADWLPSEEPCFCGTIVQKATTTKRHKSICPNKNKKN